MITLTEEQHFDLYKVSKALQLVSDLSCESRNTHTAIDPESMGCFLSLISEIVSQIHTDAASAKSSHPDSFREGDQ